MKPKFYAGIGSRRTPADVCDLMTRIAEKAHACGWTLRSGGAQGADKAFERGAGGAKEVFCASSDIPRTAFHLVDTHHPAPHRLNVTARRLLARNALQILGADMQTPVRMVLCWTPDGANGRDKPTSRHTGGTGHAIRIAVAYNIPVANLQRDVVRRIFEDWAGVETGG